MSMDILNKLNILYRNIAKKNYLLVIFFLIFLFSSIQNVNANVICNDGTISPTCIYNQSGCCSHHGGVSSTTNSYSDVEYNNYEDEDESTISGIGITIIIIIIGIFLIF